MKSNQFRDISCYEEFEIQCDLRGISKIDVLKEIGYKIYNYYFFVSNDGIFNWFDLEGNHVEYPGVLKEIKEKYIPKNITKCVILDNAKCIGYSAFQECKSLSSITIPDSVTSISGYSFAYCNSLDSITIPDSVKSVGSYAFYNCESLDSITIPNNVRNIGYNTFFYCESLEEVIFKGKTLDEVKK